MQPHCHSFIPNLFSRVRTNVSGRDFIVTPTDKSRISYAGSTQNRTPEKSSGPSIINRCWLGLLSTFVLQPPFFFRVAGNQYSDLCLGQDTHLTEPRKRAIHTNWLWNCPEKKATASDRGLNKLYCRSSFPEHAHACSSQATGECFIGRPWCLYLVSNKDPGNKEQMLLCRSSIISQTEQHP